MKYFSVSVLALTFVVAGCSSSESAGDKYNACDYIPGNTYTSVEELDGGTGSDFNWYIIFSPLISNGSGRYDWTNRDTISGGDYRCDGQNVIRVQNDSVAGRYNVETGILTWGNHEYH